MANPRIRFDEKGDPKPCLIRVPPHLSRYLYAAALKARQGKGGLQVEETDIVIGLIEKWAAGVDALEWAEVLAELKAEAEAEQAREAKKKKA